MIKESLAFGDVLLSPQYSDITSRREVSLESALGNLKFTIPIISSPMDTISEVKMARTLGDYGGLSILHRYNSIAEQANLAVDCTGTMVGAAVGTSGDYLARAAALKLHVDVICVDVAHGHHLLMRDAIKELRKVVGTEMHIMAGNVATLEGYEDLCRWGADSVRVGIGGGSICSTRIQTGHGVPTLQSILDCSSSPWAGTVAIIADGGIRTSGDIVKALAAGADFAMIGSLLSGTDEAPGEVLTGTRGKYKTYRGMASAAAQMDWRGRTASLEGISTTVPYKGSVGPILHGLENGIRSGLSYSGARSILDLHAKAKFIKQTASGQMESSTHILNR